MTKKELTKIDFIEFMSDRQKITKAESERNLSAVLSSIQAALEQGNKIALTGFGAFYISKLEAREGRNPQTGEKMKLVASNMIKFKPSAKLKEACNNK